MGGGEVVQKTRKSAVDVVSSLKSQETLQSDSLLSNQDERNDFIRNILQKGVIKNKNKKITIESGPRGDDDKKRARFKEGPASVLGSGPSRPSPIRSQIPRLHQRRLTDPTLSGYVFAPEFAQQVIDDPYELHGWVQGMTKRLYMVWVFLVGTACLLIGVATFVFHIIPEIYSHRILVNIFIRNIFSPYSVFGVIVTVYFLAVWGSFMLTHPYPKYCIVRNGRWVICYLLLLYMSYSVGIQIWKSLNIHKDLEVNMLKDLRSHKDNSYHPNISTPEKEKNITQLEKHTQIYFECCGVYGSNDWSSIARRPIPKSCCDEKAHRGCYTQSEEEKLKRKLMRNRSCLEAEYFFSAAIVGIIAAVEIVTICVTFVSTILLRGVLKHTNELEVDHVHPFT